MSYSRVSSHAAMAFDDRRNALYLRAIRQLVTPTSVVLDVGAGLGVHGLAAAAAGAAHVYLVDPSPVIRCASDVAQQNDLASRITIYRERAELVDLPQPVDLIVSVCTGNLLFDEDLLPVLFRARDKVLCAQGRMLPDRAQLHFQLVAAPHLHASKIARWSEPVIGLNFGALRRFAANEIYSLRGEAVQGLQPLTEPLLTSDLDLRTAMNAHCDATLSAPALIDGTCHGLVGWIRIRLLDEWFSTAPGEPPTHWTPMYLPIDPPLKLRAGEPVHLAIRRRTGGEWHWDVRTTGERRRHSTFFAGAEGPEDFVRASREDGRP